MRFLDRRMGQCAFITSTADAEICGQPTITTKSSAQYCKEHHKICYYKPKRDPNNINRIAFMNFNEKYIKKPSSSQ